MKRRKFLTTAGLGIAASAAAVKQAVAQQAGLPTLQWRMATSWPKSLDTLFGTVEQLGRRVGEITEGKFQIRVFAGGEIVPGLQVVDAVQNATVECGHTAPYYYVGKDPAFAFGTAVPFGLNTRQHIAWMAQGGGRQVMAPLFNAYGCHHIPAGNTGTQMGGWFRREIKSVEDLKNLKFRIGGLAGQVLTKLGTVPTQIAGGEIYQALDRGTVDAAEWVGPYDDEKLGFHKVAKFYYYPGWWEGSAEVSTVVNLKRWEELPAVYKAALEVACAEATMEMLARYDAQNPAALRRLVAGGAQLRAFPRPVLDACYDAAFELYGELSAKSAHWKRIYEHWLKFREEQFLWFRVAENSYDNYVFTRAAARPGAAKKAAPAKKN